jgi:RimJ/RimL family protein N-acetyltransferase
MIPSNLVLQNSNTCLRPTEKEDYESFLRLAQDEDAWNYFTLNLSQPDQLSTWMEAAFREKENNIRRPFTIIDKNSGSIAGSTSLGNISFHDLRLEIGWSWLAKQFRSTGINRQCKFLLMQYSFETLEFERVEFKTDKLNARARKGLEKIGGVEEGVLRSHMNMWNNRRRDSVYYSVLKREWPRLKQTIFKDLATNEIH